MARVMIVALNVQADAKMIAIHIVEDAQDVIPDALKVVYHVPVHALPIARDRAQYLQKSG